MRPKLNRIGYNLSIRETNIDKNGCITHRVIILKRTIKLLGKTSQTLTIIITVQIILFTPSS